MLMLLAVLLGQAMVPATPSPKNAAQHAMLDRVTQMEGVNDALETHFDAVCGALKAGRRQLGPALTDEGAHPTLKAVTWATACSLRALELGAPRAGQRAVHLLWEVEGRDASGARVSERGEADGAVRLAQGRWRLARFRDVTHSVVRREAPRFVERAQELGLVVPRRPEVNMAVEQYATGLAVRDFDGDGRPDVVAVDGHQAFFWRNAGPGLVFSRELLLEAPANVTLTATIAGDFDEDGDPDLLIAGFRQVDSWLFRNDGGHLTLAGRLGPRGQLHGGLASDLDGDGHLDLVLLSYSASTHELDSMVHAENGDPIVILRGDGHFGFTPWPIPAGTLTHRFSLAAIAADVLGQGRPQLYVANDFGLKDLWRFESDGGVRNVAEQYGLSDPGNGMSADVGDLDGDGRLDLYLANMFSKAGTRVLNGARAGSATMATLKKFAQGNTLYFGEPDGGFHESGEAVGVNRGLWAYGSLLTDLDDDGRLEVAVANGFVSKPIRKDF